VNIYLVLPANNDHASVQAANHSDIIQRFWFAACLKNTALEKVQGRLRAIVGAVILHNTLCTMSGFITDTRHLLGKEILDSINELGT